MRMNPACRLNLDGRECQEWMTVVCSHCHPLLPNAEQALLWDSWWPDELPVPYKTWVSTMSAFDCHRLRKAVARQVTDQLEGGLHAEASSHTVMWSFCRWTIVLLVVLTVLMSMIFALRILIESPRGRRSVDECSHKGTPPSSPRTNESLHCDVEAPPCQPFKQPRSFISFGQVSDPLTRCGPYRHQKLLRTSSLPEGHSMEQQLYTKDSPSTSKTSHSRKPPSRSSRKKKSDPK